MALHLCAQFGDLFFDAGEGVDAGEDGFIEEGVKPGGGLQLAAAVKFLAGFGVLHKVLDGGCHLFQSCLFQGGSQQGNAFPAGGGGADIVQGVIYLSFGEACRQKVIPIRFVDHDQVAELHDSFFDALQFVSGSGDLDEDKDIHHGAHGDFGLTNAHRFDEDGIIAGGFAEDDGFAGFACHSAQDAGTGGRPDEGLGMAAELFHPCFISQNAAAGDAAAGVYCQHRHLFALFDEQAAKAFDEGAFACAGYSGDADAHGGA